MNQEIDKEIKAFPAPYIYEIEVVFIYDGEKGLMTGHAERNIAAVNEADLKRQLREIEDSITKIPHVWRCDTKVISKAPFGRSLGGGVD